MTNLFTYGSLMFPAVWQQLVPTARVSSAAFLPRYSRRIILLDTYPLIVPDSQSTGILGTLYKGLNREDVARLDWFEGEIYQRIYIEVHTPDGLEGCETYVPKPMYRRLAMQDIWRGDIFQYIQMPIFLARYCANNLPREA